MQWVSSVCLSFLWDPLINIQQKLSCKSTVVKSYIPWYIYLQTFCPSGQYNITGFVYGSILIINLLFHQIRYKNVLRQYPFLATKVETQKLSLPRKGKLKIFYSQLFRSKKKWSSEHSEHFEQQYPIRAERWSCEARRWEDPKMYSLESYPGPTIPPAWPSFTNS